MKALIFNYSIFLYCIRIKGMKIVDDDDDTWKMTDPEKDDFPDKLLVSD